MEKQAAYIAKLIAKSKLEQLSGVEAAHLQDWLAISEENRELYAELRSEEAQNEAMKEMHAYREDDIRARILAIPQNPLLPTASPHIRRLSSWLPYAAAIVVLLSTGFFVWDKVFKTTDQEVEQIAVDILPGGNRATLKLADGRTIDLDEGQMGIIVGDDEIAYADGNTLVVGLNENGKSSQSEMFVLTTPKGGTYQVTLPDGSKAWLNSASTLKYPSRFSEEERIVELEGEAYFDVVNSDTHKNKQAKNSGWPFKVVGGGQDVEVLGTEFNISAYAGEGDVKTTLVEGHVRVTPRDDRAGGAELVPGEQAVFTVGHRITKREIDIDQYTAWKEGWITFQDKSFAQIMREVERWYDVDVRYEGATIPSEVGYGMAKRSENLSVILKLLESGGIRFRMDGRTLTIVDH